MINEEDRSRIGWFWYEMIEFGITNYSLEDTEESTEDNEEVRNALHRLLETK